ncbi:MAG: hypothetical protein ABI779_13950 [Acidobacteriota bacterium]
MEALLQRTGVALFALLFAGCGSLYTTPQSCSAPTWESTAAYDLGIIEMDDQGWLTNRSDAEHILEKLERTAAGQTTNIVVFVHGWHHNANPCDCNLASFRRVLERLDQEAQLEVYRGARRELAGDAEARVVGLYVGWRGRSLPKRLDYLTFWDRRPAAIRVGHGDLPGVLGRLQTIYDAGNRKKRGYTGLVSMGHSFGGQVLFAAVSDLLKSRLGAVVPLTGQEGIPVRPIDGFGDLVVLVNAALDASVYHSIDAMTRHTAFSPLQAPVMMVVSSEGDRANEKYFPIGRTFSIRHEPDGSPEQFQQKLRTLGWYLPQVTHCLSLEGGSSCYDTVQPDKPPAKMRKRRNACDCPEADAIVFDRASAERNAGVWKSKVSIHGVEEPLMDHPEFMQLARTFSAVGTRFTALDQLDPNNPFVVVKATREISDDHNDMFNPHLVDFLVRYAAGTQLKRMSVRRLEATERRP